MPAASAKLAPFLTFAGQAEAAMDLYRSLFVGSERLSLTLVDDPRYGVLGKVLHGRLLIKGQLVMFMDMAPEHAVPFSWASSLYVDCDTEAEFDGLFAGLSEGGKVMMGPEPVLNLRKVAWVTDRFGVTWQLVWT
jgi:predicted 3-demethylubiquinone-9 3-methyltransferase (glyoxalase superfamily)